MSGSKAGGRPPAAPFAFRQAIWSLRSGQVNAIPQARSTAGGRVRVGLVRDDPAGPAPRTARAPAACWCARTELESTEKTHSTFPTASSFTTTSSRMRSQVPSAVQRRRCSWAVFQGPVALREITPRSPSAQLPQDRVDHLPVIPPLAATTTATRQQRLDPRPRCIRQLAPPNHRPARLANTRAIHRTRPRPSCDDLALSCFKHT